MFGEPTGPEVLTGLLGENAGEAPQTPAARRTLRAAPSAASDSSQSGAATAGALQVRLDKAEVLFQLWEKMGRKAYPIDRLRHKIN